MRLTFLSCIFIGLASAPALALEQDSAQAAPSLMDSTFQRLGTEFVKAGNADGVSIAVVKDGKARFYNFGSVSRDRQQPPTDRTVYEIGSISKVFTSLILAHAAIEGKVNLQDDIRKYMPGEYPNLASDGTPVRLIDLANTTSALPDNSPNLFPPVDKVGPDKAPFIAVEAFKRYTDKGMLADLRTASLVDKPGVAPRHSNLAANLLASILEKVYGVSYETLLARYVERPFGMATGAGKAAADAPIGYNKRHVAMPLLDERAFLPAGGLRYSPADMAKFIGMELAAADPALQLSQKIAWGDPDDTAVAFNWVVNKTVDSKRRLRTSGSTFGFSSYIEMYPDLGYGIILLANRPGETQNQLQDLATQAMAEIWGKPPALVAFEQALQAAEYRDADNIATKVRRQHPELHLTEDYVNRWAYRLMGEKKPKQAFGLFQYNVAHWPKSWNAFDSLAEAYEALGDDTQAIAHYKRSLELDPNNKNGAEHLQKLEQRRKDGNTAAKPG